MDESPPHADAPKRNRLTPESADRTLENWLKTVDFCSRRQRVVGSHSQNVAENRYAPVREVCDYKLWVRCEASRPETGGPLAERV